MSDNNKDISSNNQEHEWEHSDFSWEAMQPDIFQKIEEEDPSFFEKDKKRIIGFWLFGAAMIGLFICGGLVSALYLNNSNIDNKNDLLVAKVNKSNPVSDTKLPTEISNDSQKLLSKIEQNKEETDSANKKKTAVVSKNKKTSTYNAASYINPKANNTQVESIQPVKTIQTISIEVNKTDLKDKVILEGGIGNSNITIENKQISLAKEMNNVVLPTLTPPSLKKEHKDMAPRGEVVATPSIKSKESAKASWRITAMGGGLLSFSKYSGISPAVALRNDHTSPWFGWQYGLKVERSITKKVNVFAGLNRSVAFQNIDIETERQVDVKHENVLLSVTNFVVGNRTESLHGDTTVSGVEHNRLVNYNELKSIEFNMGVSRIFQIGKKWGISPYVGFSTGLITQQSGVTVLASGATEAYDNDNPILKRVQFRALAGLSLEYRLSRKVALVATYQFDGQLNNGSLEQNMTWRPSHHFMALGAAYNW